LALLALGLAILMIAPQSAWAGKKQHKRHRRASAHVAALTADGQPNVQSRAVIVVDLDTGDQIFARNPDVVRPIASTTKIFVAMAVRAAGLDLDAETEIIQADVDHARGGSRSRLKLGRRFKNHDLLRAMLIASDNRACTAVARAAGLSPEALIARMNGIARKLGLEQTRFTDSSGLHGNESTAREMAIALREAMTDPVLLAIMSTREADVWASDAGEKGRQGRKKAPYSVHYFNTNVSLRTSKYKVLAGKTGYTDPARYCLITAAEVNGRKVVISLLGAEGDLTRFADFQRIASWLAGGGGRKRVVPPVKARKRDGGVGRHADRPRRVAPRPAP
jgi:D-alanyl-D-alanine endopeptidase (penicillin-binding protein 7)